MPVDKDWFVINARGSEIEEIRPFNNFIDKLSCPVLDFGLNLLMILEMLVESTNEKEKVLSTDVVRYELKESLFVEVMLAASLGPIYVKNLLNLFAISSLFVILLFSMRKKWGYDSFIFVCMQNGFNGFPCLFCVVFKPFKFCMVMVPF